LTHRVVIVAVVAACHGSAARHDAGPRGSASAVSAHVATSYVPIIPPSPDPLLELDSIDAQIAQLRDGRDHAAVIALLLERATIFGELDDYQDAVARSSRLVAEAPKDAGAWSTRVQALSRVHQFTAAREALERRKQLARHPSEWLDLEATLDEATGNLARSQPVRDNIARSYPSTANLVQQANGLALAGKLDDALALMPKARDALRDNSPELVSWLLFQWGRLYEQKGEPAAARELFAAARARMPTLEATTHLAQTMMASGDADAANKLVEAELGHHRHPELLGLAVQLGHAELAAEARAAWERYVTALPEAFADHAARFYLGPGRDPRRALELARANLANRDTREARALLVEAALAANEPKAACDAAGPLTAAGGLRAHRFTAWRALEACGRKDEAAQLARELGITKSP
jgi:tetratricopeptide (TPR) repeat protein